MKRKQLLSHVQNAATTTINQTIGQQPPSSSGAVRLSELPPNQIPIPPSRDFINSPYAERERTNISNNASGGGERREGGGSDGNSEGRRNGMLPPRVPTHGRMGTAGIYPNGRENIGKKTSPDLQIIHTFMCLDLILGVDTFMTPAQNPNRQRLGQMVGNTQAPNPQVNFNNNQNWHNVNAAAKLNVPPPNHRTLNTGSRQTLNEMSANVGTNMGGGRPGCGYDGPPGSSMQMPGTGSRTQTRQYLGERSNNGFYLG